MEEEEVGGEAPPQPASLDSGFELQHFCFDVLLLSFDLGRSNMSVTRSSRPKAVPTLPGEFGIDRPCLADSR